MNIDVGILVACGIIDACACDADGGGVGIRCFGFSVAVGAVAFVVVAVVDAACDVLLAVWLLLVDDVQPATLTISTARTPSIKTIFNLILVIFPFFFHH